MKEKTKKKQFETEVERNVLKKLQKILPQILATTKLSSYVQG